MEEAGGCGYVVCYYDLSVAACFRCVMKSSRSSSLRAGGSWKRRRQREVLVLVLVKV
jgi:hypothetical protein